MTSTNFRNKLLWLSLTGGLILSSPARTAEKIDATKFPGYVVDEVVVPVPSEIFAVLDKLGSPNWKDEVRKTKLPDTSDRMELSLIFGVVVAEGFVAVQAQDKQTVEDIGRDVINLSKKLGLGKSVTQHAQSILDAVKQNDWKAVRKELDLTQATVRSEMDRLRDGDLAQCVSLGGWLRGTASVTSVVNKNYTQDRAELLNQPLLAEHFSKSMGSMSEGARNNKLVSEINKGLTSIRKNMTADDGIFPPDKVLAIQKTCETLLALIMHTSKPVK
ncbi:MAG: hypothetical protein K8R87_10190 [Verrucomicrobia bacterium]|nr:hypothetical protein [Verrucomicrobiota bacterium]